MALFQSGRKQHHSIVYFIAISAAASLVAYFQLKQGNQEPVMRLVLGPGVFSTGSYWQFLTHIFIVPQPVNLVFKMLFIWFIGSTLETLWGTKRFLIFMGICVAGSIITWGILLFGFNMGVLFFGPGAALLGFIWVYSRHFPDQQFYMFLILPVKAKYFLLLYVGIRVLLGGASAFPMLLIELGGGGLGVLWLRYAELSLTRKRDARLAPLQSREIQHEKKLSSRHSVLLKTVEQGLAHASDAARAMRNMEEHTEAPLELSQCPEGDFLQEDNYCLECEGYPYCLRRKHYGALGMKAEPAPGGSKPASRKRAQS